MTKMRKDDRKAFRTVECWDENTGTWITNAIRVRPETAAALVANLESFGHKARIVENRHFAGVFAPSLEQER